MNVEFEAIGVIRTPHAEKVDAPRQPTAALGVEGVIEIFAPYEHALSDLEGFDRIWLLFWFHLNDGFRSKVLPPRSKHRLGVFATRSPHRPNPIGLSCVRLLRIEGLSLHVADVDLIDGTPLFDIKPYIAYTDAFPDASAGWLTPQDPRPTWTVEWTSGAVAQALFIEETSGLPIRARTNAVLSLGPLPHPYRRIRKTADGHRLALKEWRMTFRVTDRHVEVINIRSGYRATQLEGTDPSLDVHRQFVARFEATS